MTRVDFHQPARFPTCQANRGDPSARARSTPRCDVIKDQGRTHCIMTSLEGHEKRSELRPAVLMEKTKG